MEGMEQQRLESEGLPNSKITVLINKIAKMSKNPTIEADLSQVLDDFLQKMSECEKYLENGIFNMNFAEAALLLQSSADLYSKKVDLLWDIIFDYQKRLLLSEEQNADNDQEIEKLEERKRKYKRKRKTNSDENQNAKLVNNFSFGSVENFDYLNQNYDTTDLSKDWAKFDTNKQTEIDTLHGCGLDKKFLFLPNNSVYTEDNDYVGRYDQFHSASIIEEIFHLEKQKLLPDDCNCVTRMRIDSYMVNDFLLEKSIPSDKSKDSYSTQLTEYINDFVQSHNQPEKTKEQHTLPPCKKSFVYLERLPFSLMRDKLRRASLADSLFDDDNMSSVSGTCPSPCHSIGNEPKSCANESCDQMTGALENRSKSCSQDSAFYEDMEEQEENEAKQDVLTANDVISPEGVTDFVKATDEAVVDVAEAVVETVTESVVENVTEAVVENVTEAVVDNVTEAKEIADVESMAARSSPITNQKQPCVVFSVVTRLKTRKRLALLALLEESKEEEEQEVKKRKVQKRRRVSEKTLKKLATGLTAEHRDFEKFCRLQYKPADGEGIVPPDLSDVEESDEEDPVMSEEEEDNENEEADTGLNSDEEPSDLEDKNEEAASDGEACEDPDPEVSLPDISSLSPIHHLNQPSCSTSEGARMFATSTPRVEAATRFSSSDVDLEEEEISRKNVREWRSFILPKLRNMENRADFDIHEYGSEIIEPLQIGEQRHFKDIVQGKNAAEVARYFIATLQLANTYNVEITGAVPGEVANDNFQIKTLDKTRHHELLEEYQAPSEETFRERLERAQALNPKVSLHSTPNIGPPDKKPKLKIISKKKLF